MGKILKYTDSEQLMTAKTDYSLTDYEGEESTAWISRFVNLKKPGYCATLIHRTEKGLNLKSECILVSAMVHLPQEWNFGSQTSMGNWC